MMSNRLAQLTLVGALGVSATVVGTNLVSGADESAESIFVSITPCRLVDTRPDTAANPDINVGPRDTKLDEDETALFTAWGTGDADSPCDIPNSATAIATNTVAISPTARSFMTLYPGDVDNPGTANLNYVAGQAPTPNSANVPLSPTGTFNVFNAFGEVHVVIDINGYYQPATSDAPTGDPGPRGDGGSPGAQGPDGAPGALPETNRIPLDDILEERWDRDPARQADISGFQSVDDFASDGTFLYAATRDGIAIIDPATNQLLDTILDDPVNFTAQVWGVAVAGDSLYASFLNQDRVAVIDLATRTESTSIPMAQPGELAVIDGLLYASFDFNSSTHVIDPATNGIIDSILFTNGVTKGYASSSGFVFQAVTSGVYVIDASDPTNHVLIDQDPSSPGFIDPISGNNEANDIVVVGDELWVSGGSSNDLQIIDPVTFDIVGTVAIGIFTEHLAFDGRRVYQANTSTTNVTVIDPRTRSIVGTIQAAEPSLNLAVGALHFDGTNVWAGDFNGQEIHRLLPR